MPAECTQCPEVTKLLFEIKGQNLTLKEHAVIMDGIQQENLNRDIEHETMIQGLTTRMDNLTSEFASLKKDVKDDMASMRQEIPKLFEDSMNKLLAKVGKWFLVGVLALLVALIIAWNKPFILSFLGNVTQQVEEMK